ncbi:MAG: phosphatidate cytidylyltransferase [Corticimicrobacter sp.]|uniref:phosphatidate cytidylyltransferase n=1 Tax=Corticimicrobacter sp. TaxID=2678536 RepID=UPI0032DA6C34
MLRERVITAIILLAIVAAVLAAPGTLAFAAFILLTIGCALWEWLRLTGLAAYPRPSYYSVPLGMLAVPVLTFAGCALYFMYSHHGAIYLLSVLALVWIADIGAYFAGKAFGRHKLAPTISPGKTREGALAGIAAAVLWVLLTALWSPDTFGAALVARFGVTLTVVLAIVLAALSIAGDLFESWLKRRAGAKDSSRLLPGHGGVLDRIDAILPVAPLAWVLSVWSH